MMTLEAIGLAIDACYVIALRTENAWYLSLALILVDRMQDGLRIQSVLSHILEVGCS